MHPTRERTPSVPWSRFIKKNPEKIDIRACIRFSLDKNNIVCSDFNERKEDLYVYNQFAESNASKLPTRKVHPFPDSKLKIISFDERISKICFSSPCNRCQNTTCDV